MCNSIKIIATAKQRMGLDYEVNSPLKAPKTGSRIAIGLII